ncbi:hypothetical protein D7030_00905 [Flavobacteriaceae bacterium AU392]|nr:hypothetical protein D1817_03020 [Flavobacteriaceae bacterium]RKM86617.1 hypothetical protein D7030_00905 [Flavobacteriaceae bacterium AU392]
MPLLGALYYFKKTPRHFPDPVIKAKLLALVLLTIILPILIYFLLKSLNKVKTINLETTQERIFPLVLNAIIIILILRRIFTVNDFYELYFFFVGAFLSTIVCLVLVLSKFKASIHMIAISGVLMFFIGISIHFSKNSNLVIALLFLISGAIASSRLYLKAHTPAELIIGFFIGFIPQLILFNYWL